MTSHQILTIEGIEMPLYVNERPRPPRKQSGAANQSDDRKPFHLLLLSFGLLCIVQATLNISLHLMSHSSKQSTHLDGNKTKCSDEKLSHDIVSGSDASSKELSNRIKNVEMERDRLKTKLRELTGCVTSQQCPVGWRRINSRCYFLSRENKTWVESRQDCHSKNAELVVINSEQEQRALQFLGNDLRFWIGLHDTTGTGTFKWVDGSALTKPFWRLGQAGHGCVRNRKDCVAMNTNPGLERWFDASCSFKLSWLCERSLCTDD